MDRKLASIQKIATISPIEGADKIQVCTMEGLGWECVIKKDEFKVGDKVVYVEVDSIVPERQEFEFLRERKFRVRTIKLRKQVSQGLVLPMSVLPPLEYDFYLVGNDVTEELGIKKYDPQAQEEDALVIPKHRSPVMKFLMKNKAFRTVYMKLNSKEKGQWPNWIAHTDEERIQTCAKILMNNFNKPWYITEKLDGQSATFFTHYERVWGFRKLAFGVCSRNIWLKTPDNSNYWKIAKMFDLEKKLKACKEEIVIQGEILAPNVQKNKYGVTEPDFYVFNIIRNGKRVGHEEMVSYCVGLGLKHVPIVFNSFMPGLLWNDLKEQTQAVVKHMVDLSIGYSRLAPTINREGIVVRLMEDPVVSLKVINPEFLLKNGE
jgi:hypothetical protein